MYRLLLQAINAGRFRPGDRIRESEAAVWLGVSRTPVREALRWLESEDVLQKSTQGLTVTTISDEEVLELYELREVLEGMAAHCAATRADKSDLRRLRRSLDQASRLRDPQLAQVLAVNREFHLALAAAAAHNRYISKTLDAMQDAFLRLPSTTFFFTERLDKIWLEHERIVHAIERGDAAASDSAARSHIRASRRLRLAAAPPPPDAPRAGGPGTAGPVDPPKTRKNLKKKPGLEAQDSPGSAA